ncbi:hypothetical protein W97_08656 [Coniosporium apollinis CBS 100218]|uniref:Uncharacterized protein n=1 Tax=Coniosporium apollinis (strain CBS 100218) TaxID=1168221 RepID=R7Z632_CONA1|nr:uncharacterized protein W97_08656 [Coniosporium apollinis CBS 100218]EON69396.1 hypothetical protein W97_08656 [Coniosporium apollinis CBS 100218]
MHKIQQRSFKLQAVLGLRFYEAAPFPPVQPVIPDVTALSVAVNRGSLESQHDTTSPAVPPQQSPASASPNLLASETWDPSYWSFPVDPAIGVISLPKPVSAMWWTPGLAHDLVSWHELLSARPQPQQGPMVRSTPLQRITGTWTATAIPQILFDMSLTKVGSITLYDITIPPQSNHSSRYSAGRWLFILMNQATGEDSDAPSRPASSIPTDHGGRLAIRQAPAQAADNVSQHHTPAHIADSAAEDQTASANPERNPKRRKTHSDMPAPPLPHQYQPQQRNPLSTKPPLPPFAPGTSWQLLALPLYAVTSQFSRSTNIPTSTRREESSGPNNDSATNAQGARNSRELVQTELRLGRAGFLPLVDGHELRFEFWDRFCHAMGKGQGALMLLTEEVVGGIG